MSDLVRPPVPYALVENLIQRLEASDPTLGRIAKMAYQGALKKAEIVALTVGEAERTMAAGRFRRNLPAVREIVQAQIAHLREQRLPLTDATPLFPQDRRGTTYHLRQLTRRMKIFSRPYPCSPTLDKIRQSGICKYYENLGGTNPLNRDGRLAEASRFARVSLRQTRDILRGAIPCPKGYLRHRQIIRCASCPSPCGIIPSRGGQVEGPSRQPASSTIPLPEVAGVLPETPRAAGRGGNIGGGIETRRDDSRRDRSRVDDLVQTHFSQGDEALSETLADDHRDAEDAEKCDVLRVENGQSEDDENDEEYWGDCDQPEDDDDPYWNT